MGFEPTTFCMASRRSSQLSYSRPGAPSIAAVPPPPSRLEQRDDVERRLLVRVRAPECGDDRLVNEALDAAELG